MNDSPPTPCPLCTKIAHPTDDLVWEFPESFAYLGPWQFYTGYCVLVSKSHAEELSELGSRRRDFLGEMALLAEVIEKAFAPHKMNYELLGNQVRHLHWHLFPRSADDPDRLRPVWFALEAAERNEDEKRRLETGTATRAETIHRLRETIARLLP